MRASDAVRIADVYARCLRELTPDPTQADAVERDMNVLSVTLEEEPRLKAFLTSPRFSEAVKQDLIRKVFGERVDRLTMNFLMVVVAHHREAVLERMIERYKELSRVERGCQAVTATVAKPLSAEQRVALSDALAKSLNAEVQLDTHVDPSIIGGVVIRYAGRMVDNSVRGRLHRIIGEIAQRR